MKTAKDLTRDELEAIVETAQRAFWMLAYDHANKRELWDGSTPWSWERVEEIASVMVSLGLNP